MINKDDWEEAEDHLKNTIKEYEKLKGIARVNPTLALRYVLKPLLKRYESGERSQNLFVEMIEVK